MPKLRDSLVKRAAAQEEERYRNIIRSSARATGNRHVAAESKMLDAQHEAEQTVLARRRARRGPRANDLRISAAMKGDKYRP